MTACPRATRDVHVEAFRNIRYISRIHVGVLAGQSGSLVCGKCASAVAENNCRDHDMFEVAGIEAWHRWERKIRPPGHRWGFVGVLNLPALSP